MTEKARAGTPSSGDQTNYGDLRVGQIQSTGSCTGSPPCNFAAAPAWLVNALGDVTLRSPAAILDAELDNGHLGTDPTPTDVIAPNRNGDPPTISGHGGVGVPKNFLEIRLTPTAALGVLTITDTASGRHPGPSTPYRPRTRAPRAAPRRVRDPSTGTGQPHRHQR